MSRMRTRGRGMVGGASWSPADLPGAIAWYDGSVSLLDDVDGIYQWSDGIGTLHATQATGSKKPALTTINSLEAALFDGTDDRMSTGAVTAIGSGNFYSASVVSFTSGLGSEKAVFEWGGSLGLVLRGHQGVAQLQLLHASTAFIGTGAFPQDAPCIVEVQKSGTSFSVWVNGGSDLGPWTYAPALNGSAALHLGTDNTLGYLWPGKQAEHVFCLAAQTSDDRTTLRDYLSAKWGIS